MKIVVFMFVIGIILITAMLIYSILIGDDEDSIEFKAYRCVTSKRGRTCDGNCESCAWYIGPDETLDGRESTKGE